MPDKELLAAANAGGALACAVAQNRKGDELKILVGLDQRIDDLQGAGRIDVVIEHAVGCIPPRHG